ncbi:imidazolonepropionase [bacterium]|nr:imidazolonepropionase [bacterium]
MKKTLLKNIAQLIRVAQQEHGRGNINGAMNELSILHDAAILFSDRFEWIGSSADFPNELSYDQVIDCSGKVILPGFVDSHTHCVFAGDRSDEFARRLRGVSYTQIASEGGGILATVSSVRNASIEELAERGMKLAMEAMNYGTTTIEMKSGYGLSLESELSLLKAIDIVRKEVPIRIISTFMGAHDFPPEYSDDRSTYVDLLINEMLPSIKEQGLAEFCDIFTDTGYFTIHDSMRILESASALGFKLKVHADELTPFGAAEMAGAMHAVSADHLLFCSQEGMKAMKQAGTIATLLPGTAYTLKLQYAPARTMIEQGLIVALATDCNPGSCYTPNMQLILSLACTNMGMSIEEAITASTLHGALALCAEDICGSIEVNKSADFIMLDTHSYPDIVYHFGVNHVQETWAMGKRVV